MLTGTTQLALRALILLAQRADDGPVSPRRLAQTLGCSQSYLSKTLGLLVKGAILRSTRGVHGGVTIARSPAEITLMDVVQSCQGLILGDYCERVNSAELGLTCGFHRVMAQLHEHIVHDLDGCTLAELLACPAPNFPHSRTTGSGCRMRLAPATALRRPRIKNHKSR